MTNDRKNNEIIKVEPKPIQPAKTGFKTGGLRIGRVNTLNLIVEPLKKRYHKHYQSDKIHLIVDLALAAIILILLGVLVNLWLFSRSQINLMSFQVTSNPAKLTNGQVTQFTLDYANTTNDQLNDVALVLKLPASLKNPEYSLKDFDIKTNTLNIGRLPAKAHGQFQVSGLLLGNFQDKQEFIAAINYKNKYGQARQEFFSQDFTLSDSVLKTEIKFLDKVIANSIFPATLNVTNTSNYNFDIGKVQISGPDNFSLRQISLEKVGPSTYLLGNLKAGQNIPQDFTAKLSSHSEETITVTTEILATYQGQEYVLNKIDTPISASLSKLNLGFLNMDANQNIAPGETTTYTLHYQNNENYPLNNVELGIDLAGDYADPNYLARNYSHAQGPSVIFNQKNYPELAQIKPGQEGSIKVTVAAKKDIVFTQYLENGYQLQAAVLANYDDPELKSRVSLESDPVFTQVDSVLSLNTTALFYTLQGDQIGVGSVPPQVGQYASYWVIIKVNNTSNKLKGLKITAQVPAGIEFTNVYNVTDGDQINFDENSRTLTWNISNVTAFAGIFNPSPEARIQLAITPTADQIGTSPLLLSDIKATATDEATNAFLSATGSNVNIAIFSDQGLNKVSQ